MAKRFVFELEPVLKYRQRIEEEMRSRLLQIQHLRDATQAEIDRLEAESQKARSAMIEAKSGPVDMDKVRQYNRYITGLGISARQKRGELESIEIEVEKRRIELVEARKAVKALEKLKARRRKEYDHERSLEEVKMLDELGSERHRRRAKAEALRSRALDATMAGDTEAKQSVGEAT